MFYQNLFLVHNWQDNNRHSENFEYNYIILFFKNYSKEVEERNNAQVSTHIKEHKVILKHNVNDTWNSLVRIPQLKEH